MIQEIKYTTIHRVLENLHDDSLMHNLTLEQAVRHTIRFIGKNGLPKMYSDRQAVVDIHEFRGILPCDLISIKQVKDLHTGICLNSMTDSFDPEHTPRFEDGSKANSLTFKTSGRVIFTSFPEGQVEIAYRAIPVDEVGFPLLIDNEVYLSALESYITMKVLQQKFRRNEISASVYQDAQQEYAWDAAQLNSELVIPSESEMESIARMWNTFIPKMREFDSGFNDLSSREYLRKH